MEMTHAHFCEENQLSRIALTNYRRRDDTSTKTEEGPATHRTIRVCRQQTNSMSDSTQQHLCSGEREHVRTMAKEANVVGGPEVTV